MDKSVEMIERYLASLPPGKDREAADILRRVVGAMNAGAMTLAEVQSLSRLRGDDLLDGLKKFGLIN